MSIYIYPTDTVWGIGASIYDQKASLAVHRIKKSDQSKPLSILFADCQSVIQHFKLPQFIDLQLLKTLFSLETTLGLPLSCARLHLPSWVVQESGWVGIRCLEFPWIKEMLGVAKDPISTTSLNLAGESPCNDLTSAKNFFKRHCPEAHFFSGGPPPPSGASSTIVLYGGDTFKLMRRGRKFKEIDRLLHPRIANKDL